MTTLQLTVCKNDRYFQENLILIDHTDTISYDMTEENVDRIKALLPIEHKSKLIISINKVTDVITHKGEAYHKE